MNDSSHSHKQFQKHLKDEWEKAGYDWWRRLQVQPPQEKGLFDQVGDVVSWIVFAGVGLLIVITILTALGIRF